MAAVDPSESPKRQKSPAEEEGTCGEKTETVGPGCSPNEKDETTANKPTESSEEVQRASPGKDGGCITSHSEVTVESSGGAVKTTCNSPKTPPTAEKNTEAPGEEQRDFDWSDTEDDDGKAPKQKHGSGKRDLNKAAENAEEAQKDTYADGETTDDAEEILDEEEFSNADAKSTDEPVGEMDGTEDAGEDDEEAEGEERADPSSRQRKCRLECKDCGKRFARREMFNLHRHFHAHEDELAPLTCKECGLTFQHRSSLIKHRNVHRKKEEQYVVPKKEVESMGMSSYECAGCQRIFTSVGKLRNHNCCTSVEKPYHCPLCRQEFQFKVSVTKHMMTHSQESNFTCQECSQTFRNSMALRHHQRCHAALKPYECPECGMVFKHYSVMEDHRRKHTDNTRSHLCNICGKTFKYSSLLHQHQYLHTGQKPFRCPECGKKFAFAQNMKAHCRQHRRQETNSASEQAVKPAPVPAQETVRGVGKENTNQSEDHKRPFNCPLCPQTFLAPTNLRAHMLIHEAEYEKLERNPRPPTEINRVWDKGITCPHCPGIFRDESSLNVHVLSVHKSIAQLVEETPASPKKQFIPVSSVSVQNKWKSEGLKSYKCPECAKTFRHRSVLELHMRIHSKDKPYQCKVCSKSFRFSSYLQQHLIIHTGKKPYKCPDCGKDFAFMQNMKTHQKLHQEKPFRCTSCRKGYSDEAQLQQHMLSHNGDKPHKCDQCDKSFGLAYLLRDHMNTHTGERPHHCNECNKSFSWFSSLLVHQKIHARKRQSFSQLNSLPLVTRMRGGGIRGRRDRWGLSRPLGGSGMVSPQVSPYPTSVQRDADLQRTVQTQSSMLSSHMDLQSRPQKEPWLPDLQPQPVQWKVDGGEIMPIPSSQHQHSAPQPTHFESASHPTLQQHLQRSPGWAENPSISQSGSTSVHSSEPPRMRESPASVVGSFLAALPQKSSPSAVSEMEQHRQLKPPSWGTPPTSTVLTSTSSLQHDFSVPSYMDGAALWSIRPNMLSTSQSSPNQLGQELQLPRWSNAPLSLQKEPSTPPKKEESRVWDMGNPQIMPPTVSQPEKPWNGCELQNQWTSGLAGASTSVQIDQSSAMPISTPVSHGVGSTLWDLQAPPGIPKTINSEKLVNNQDFQMQQKQVSPSWASVQSQTQQKVPISIQYESHRFGQGLVTPVWGFQSNPVGPQSLLSGQLKPGNGQELQQQPMVTGTQIIINQPSPFFSPPLAPLPPPPPLALPGPHPLHSVAVGALPRPPHPNIFFTPQAVMSERPHMPQTMPLPQLAPRTEPHKLGPRLPFAPERLLQCMICGCSLPRELDLQMHYLQHAQGEI